MTSVNVERLPFFNRAKTFFDHPLIQPRWKRADPLEVGKVAVNYFTSWLPWGKGRNQIDLDTELTFSNGKTAKAADFVHAALYSASRNILASLREGKMSGKTYNLSLIHPNLTTAGEVLAEAETLKAAMGIYAEGREEVGRLKRKLFDLNKEINQQFPIDGSRFNSAFREKNSALNLLEKEIRNKESVMEAKNAEIQAKPVPLRLLVAAIDAANFEHIGVADQRHQVQYSGRMAHVHGPLLRSLGTIFHEKDAGRFETSALEIRNPETYGSIADAVVRAYPVYAAIHAGLTHFVAGLIGQASKTELSGSVKDVASIERKFEEPPKPDLGDIGGPRKYKRKPQRLHDLVRFRLIHPGNSDEEVYDLKKRLMRPRSHGGLVGAPMSLFGVQGEMAGLKITALLHK